MLIEKYSALWVKSFETLKLEIESELIGIDHAIEHVGSTAVLNLDSKPIIDIDIIYQNQTDFELIKSKLIKIDYYHNGNQGIEEREVFKRDGKYENKILDQITHHLYVCSINSKALERHLLTRDFLRKNNWARLEYQSIKYKLAIKANQNKSMYTELKEKYANDFIDSIV